MSCPFEGCSSTGRISSLRAHVNDAHVRAGFVVADSWLKANDSRLCSCKVLITSNSNRCSDCRARPIDAVLPSKARYLPALHLNHVVQLSLGTTTEALDSRLPEPSTSAGSGSLLARKVCSLLADGSCNCGDTGCDVPVPVHYDVSCRSSDFAHSGGSSSSMSSSSSLSDIVGTITDCSLGGGVSVCLSTPTDSLNLLPFDQEMKERVSGEEDKKLQRIILHTRVRSGTVASVGCPVVESKVRASEKERERRKSDQSQVDEVARSPGP